jgi:hypothetical protein
MTEQQEHLTQAIEQQKQVINDINNLNTQLNTKKEILYKLQGIIEYLEQVGVSLPQEEILEEEEKE